VERVRIGGGLGFYGDTFLPAVEMIEQGAVDFVCFEDLAELTLAILEKDRERDPAAGYTKDFGPMLRACLKPAHRHGVRLITNAGGLNPREAGRVALTVARDLGVPLRVAVVEGDALLDRLDAFLPFSHLETGEPLPEDLRRRALFANVYLGAAPIVEALNRGADLVVSGRVADPSLYLAPLVHRFGWAFDDWERMAQGTVVGHLLECSSQVTGGNHGGRWWEIEGLDHVGFPIAEVDESGDIVITKIPGSGGRVTFDTVREQLLYEIHDPAAYLTPDVVLDLTHVALEETGPDRVRVTGVRGHPRPDRYKALLGYQDGYMGQALVGYSWPDALKKAEATADILRRQLARLQIAVEEVRVEYLGWNSLHGPLADPSRAEDLNEVYLRFVVRTPDRRAAEQVSRLAVPLALGGPPTASGFIGFDRVRQLLGLWPSLVDRELVDAGVTVQILEAAP
jgi:hypothetical protein